MFALRECCLEKRNESYAASHCYLVSPDFQFSGATFISPSLSPPRTIKIIFGVKISSVCPRPRVPEVSHPWISQNRISRTSRYVLTLIATGSLVPLQASIRGFLVRRRIAHGWERLREHQVGRVSSKGRPMTGSYSACGERHKSGSRYAMPCRESVRSVRSSVEIIVCVFSPAACSDRYRRNDLRSTYEQCFRSIGSTRTIFRG